jgi:hypothetical protein
VPLGDGVPLGGVLFQDTGETSRKAARQIHLQLNGENLLTVGKEMAMNAALVGANRGVYQLQ